MKKVKTLLLALVALAACGVNQLKAQNPDFILSPTYTQNNSNVSVIQPPVTDALGNYYVVFYFAEQIADSLDIGFGGQHSYLKPLAPGQASTCIVKYDSHFNIQWINSVQGGAEFSALALAENGTSIVAVGVFSNTPLFYKNQTAISNFNLTSYGSQDVMIVKYDTAGNGIYAEHFGGADNDYASTLTLDNSGRMILTGAFGGGQCNFDPQGQHFVNGTQGGNYNNYAGWYNVSDGSYVQVDAWIQPELDWRDVALTANGDVILAGSFSGTMNADPTTGTTNVTSNGSADCLMVELSSTGAFVSSFQIGGTGNDQFTCVKVYNGNIYLGGFYESAGMNFNPAGVQTFPFEGGSDAFFMELNQNLVFQYAKVLGGDTSLGISQMAVNQNGIYTVGTFSGTVDFDPSALVYNLSGGTRGNGFWANYDLYGNFISATALRSTTGSSLNSIMFPPNSSDYVVLTGYATAVGPVDMGFSDSLNYNFVNTYQPFLAVYDFFAPQPTMPASNITFSNVTAQSMTVNFTPGNGALRLVVASQGRPVDTLPVSPQYYSADSAFAQGVDLGGANYPVYNYVDSSVTVTGLQPLTTYYFTVFEYNGNYANGNIKYLTANAPVGHQQTLASPYRWVDSVIAYSTQYDSIDWSANQVKGANDVYPAYGDNIEAWASLSPDSAREWLEVHMQGPATQIKAVNIFETYNPGAVDSVYAWDDSSANWILLWSGEADTSLPAVSRINRITFAPTTFNVSALRVAINSPAVPGWNEIDAINVEDTVINQPMAISNLQANENVFSLYPNPCQDLLNIHATGNDELKVYDALGRQLYAARMENSTLQLSTQNWGAGIYFIKYGQTTQRFVKE